MAVSFRNFLYDRGLLKNTKLSAFVISIGNITTGGTGKTPVTCEIANYLNKQGKKVAVISRGYGGKLNNKKTNIISSGRSGEKIYYNAELAGDEPYWIAKNSPGTVVITGKDRIKSGKFAINEFNAEVLILDDGFQHRKLHRDLDIVLVDSEKLYGNGFLLPAGPLREPVSELRRATRIIKPEKYCEKINGINRVLAFTGIAQPDSFFKFLEEQSIEIIIKKVFPDHYLYTEEDIKTLCDEAQKVDAEALITTEKDIVKIEPILDKVGSQIPIHALKLKVNLDVENILQTFLQGRQNLL
ncbi:MAG: tetraacyldisaccharide 4'-kinase [Candidatus Melainabacteria bacterium GWF2_37_15]|nr:MAG: tetraacyldisaccharide 4'-kinase [Candidatus Melainabacteria bacterium GWF2_37_15]